MKIEIPKFKRCCFCVPLRIGIIVFGYLNLVLSILLLSLTSWIVYGESISSSMVGLYRGVNFITQFWFPVALLVFDIIFNFLLIVGLHMDISKLIRAYYYYGVMTTFAAFIVFVVIRIEEWNPDPDIHIMDAALAFCGIVVQLYLLLLIHSELDRRKKLTQHHYVNHLAEVTVEPVLSASGRNPL